MATIKFDEDKIKTVKIMLGNHLPPALHYLNMAIIMPSTPAKTASRDIKPCCTRTVAIDCVKEMGHMYLYISPEWLNNVSHEDLKRVFVIEASRIALHHVTSRNSNTAFNLPSSDQITRRFAAGQQYITKTPFNKIYEEQGIDRLYEAAKAKYKEVTGSDWEVLKETHEKLAYWMLQAVGGRQGNSGDNSNSGTGGTKNTDGMISNDAADDAEPSEETEGAGNGTELDEDVEPSENGEAGESTDLNESDDDETGIAGASEDNEEESEDEESEDESEEDDDEDMDEEGEDNDTADKDPDELTKDAIDEYLNDESRGNGWGPNDAVKEQTREATRELESSGALGTSSWGTSEGGCMEKILAAAKSPVDPMALIRSFIRNICLNTKSPLRSRLNRRYGYNVPGSIHEYTTRILVCGDSSGSMGSNDIMDTIGLIIELAANDAEIDFCWWDCSCTKPEHLSKRDTRTPKQINVVGGGGTNPSCIFKMLDENHLSRKYSGMIIFSDMEFGEVRKPLNFRPSKITWIGTKNGTNPPRWVTPDRFIKLGTWRKCLAKKRGQEFND